MASPYRKNVIAAMTNPEGLFLVCERTGITGSWQFPQGGMEKNETPEQSLIREMAEELGCSAIEIVRSYPESVCYDFPVDMKAPIAKKYKGQEQYWFHTRFLENHGPDLDQSDGEFQAFRWVGLDEVLNKIVDWKLQAYITGLQKLGFPIPESFLVEP